MKGSLVYITKSKLNSYQKQLTYMEGDGSKKLAELLASSPGSGMGRPLDLPVHNIARIYYAESERLGHIIRNCTIIDSLPKNLSVVGLGATVTFYDVDTGEFETFTILGQEESEPSRGRISFASPVGAALMGRKKGDLANIPSTGAKLRIEDIQYNPLNYDYSIKDWESTLNAI